METLPRRSIIHVAPERPPFPLPDRITVALSALRESARQGLLAFCVGVGAVAIANCAEVDAVSEL